MSNENNLDQLNFGLYEICDKLDFKYYGVIPAPLRLKSEDVKAKFLNGFSLTGTSNAAVQYF